MMQTPDFRALEARARRMSMAALYYSRDDAMNAAMAAEDLEKAGIPITGKTGGYYRDESSVYSAEINRRVWGER